ncbi:MAG: hypothetical protein JSR89_18185 [Proteobacteria bacterium]|nr:hypothetical protein [Pseudomonadota bacterium]
MQPLRSLGALLLALGACAWALTFLGLCPARLGFAFSLMCSGLAWALVPWWQWSASPDADTPSGSSPSPDIAAGPTEHSVTPQPEAATTKPDNQESEPHATTAREHALRFCLDALAPARANTPVTRLYSAYHAWCAARGEAPYATLEIGTELVSLFERTGIEIIEVDGTRLIAGARLRLPAAA